MREAGQPVLRMFYFSGTGNARAVANWIGAAWREDGRPVEVTDLSRVDPRALAIEAGDQIGLASPTHGFNFPPITLRFLFAFPRAPRRNRAFILNTRGGVRLFGLHLPGLSGAAELLAALALLVKGYRVVGMRPIDMPSSWTSLHPGLSATNVRFITDRCFAITRRFAERMIGGGRDLRALRDLPQDLLLAPVALGYYLVGRFVFAKSFIASSACDGCGACLRQCPTGALRTVAGRPFWTWRCESCMRCMNHCPRRAIETAHGFVAAFALAFSASLSPLVDRVWPRATWWVGEPSLAEAGHVAFDSAVMLVALFACYRLLHSAMRFRPIERLAVLTSLTRFGFWRRYRCSDESRPAGAAVGDAGDRVFADRSP